MWKKALICIALIFIATLVYAAPRTVLGQYWAVVNGKLRTRLDVDLPGNLSVEGNIDAKEPIGVGGGLNLHGSGDYFKILVSGIHPNDPGLPVAFDNTLVFETIALDNQYNMEIVFWERENARPSLVLNQGAPNRASFIERSLIVGAQKGLKALDGSYTLCNDFPNLACDTSAYGADFGVENDLEVLGILYADQIKESTPGAGILFNKLKGDEIEVDDIEVNVSIKINEFAGGGNRIVRVDDTGMLYVE